LICVNGREQVAWEPDMTVTRLLEIMRYSFPTIIVSVDGDLVEREEYDTRLVPDGADVRVIHMVAGG